MAKWVFEFNWTASPWVPLATGACGAALAMLAGYWMLREVLQRPVVVTLRQAAD
jgi:putative ABC transport system permease protein